MKTIEEVLAYLQGSIQAFEKDPPDSKFQEGYLAALEELQEAIKEPRAKP